MKNLCEKFNWKIILVAFIIFAVMLWLIDFSSIGCAGMEKVAPGAKLLDYDCAYSLDEAYGKLEAMGEPGRDFYLNKVLFIDIFYPPTLMFFLFSALSALVKNVVKSEGKARLLPFLAVGYLIGDWGENVGIFLMLKNFPKRLAGACLYTSCISTVKVLCMLAIIISLIVLTISFIVKQLKGTKQN